MDIFGDAKTAKRNMFPFFSAKCSVLSITRAIHFEVDRSIDLLNQ